MASTSKDISPTVIQDNPSDDLEPGACYDSILNPTDSFEEFASEMSSSLQERNLTLATKNSTIYEIQSEIGESSKDAQIKPTKSTDDLQAKDVSFFFLCDSLDFSIQPIILEEYYTSVNILLKILI